MNLRRWTVAAALLTALAASSALAQTPAEQPAPAAPNQETASPSAAAGRADAYFNFTMGHIYEQQYENTSKAEYATQAIEFYKKAYALDPKSPVIGERLAEMYWKAQRVHDAVAEAQEILKRDPDDVQTRRLLARIYIRSLGDLNASGGQSEIAGSRHRAVQRNLPARSFRHGIGAVAGASISPAQRHDKAEDVLRGILKGEPDNEAAIEQLTQLLLDEGKSSEAVSLLEGLTSRAPSPILLDLLGDAYTQTKDLAKAEQAYRRAVDLDPSELSHLRGLGQTLMAEEKYPDALVVYQKLIDLMPDDGDNYLRTAQIYREMHQLDHAEENLLKARQYEPGSLEVMYNEAMLYQAQGRYDDAIRVLVDAVTGVKGQSPVLPVAPPLACHPVPGAWRSLSAEAELLLRPSTPMKNWAISATKKTGDRACSSCPRTATQEICPRRCKRERTPLPNIPTIRRSKPGRLRCSVKMGRPTKPSRSCALN